MLPTIPAPAPEQWPAPVVVWQQAGSSGQFNASVDLVRGSARQGAAPSLALVHQPGSNAVFGLGWSLVAPSVMRGNGRQLPRYRDEGPEADAFVVSGIGELVPWLVHEDADWQVERGRDDGELVTRYRPRVESDFARVERRTTRDTGEVYWRTVTRDNITRHYGRTEGTRVADPADRRRIVQWLLEEEWDSRGNRVRYEYKRENLVGVSPGSLPERHRLAVARPEAMLHPKRVLWGNSDAGGPDDWLFELVFDYGEHDDEAPTREERRPWQLRADAFSSCRAGFELRTRRRCRRVLLFHNIPELGRPSTLVRAHELTYESTESFSRLVAVTMRGYGSARDGASAVGQMPKVDFTYTNAESPSPSSEVRDQHGRPAVVDGSAQQWIDLDGSALPGLLVRDPGGALRYRANLGDGRLAEPTPLPSRPALTDAELPVGQAVGQPFGDGRSCLIDLLTGPGYQERAATDRWRPYTPFPSAPTMRTNATGGRDVDLDGDGRGDLLLLGATGLRWHSFAGRGGWEAGREASAPASALAALADRTGTVLLADMNGDGLADLVEVRPGRIRYWPSLGHGRFGEPVTMAGSPRLEGPDAFDPARVRLVDIDGSGSADLVYLGRSGVVWYPNQAGNSFGSPRTVPGLPPFTDLDAVDVVDLLGSGTGCLVWSSPLPGHARRPLRYVELTGGVRPHQLIRIHNGQGLAVALRYRPSAELAIEDRRAGRPWFATPPNSMSVLTELRETDLVSGVSHTTRWSYRHGCYDREEREFAGFAFVERRESWDVPSGPAGAPADLPQPERITRTWQHTGTEDWAELHERLAAEFFAGDPTQPTGPAIVVEDSTGCGPRELLRSLRGRPVREEVYDARDPTLAVPLTVVENGYLLRGLQPGRGSERASVVALPRETVERVYEGTADDHRVVQRLALDFDPFGNVLREATLAYPRRAPREPEQNRFLVTLQERDVLNRDEGPWYRLGLPVAERTFELGPLAPPAAGGLVRGSELVRLLTSGSLAVVPFEHDLPATGLPGRRLLASTQTFYWDDDLAAAAPLGNAGGRGLLHHARRAAFTPALLTEVFGQDEPDRRELEAAGYELDQGLWWASGPIVRYGPAVLYQPVSAVTPRGGEHTVVYDTHALLVVETRDPVGNTVRAEPDYRTLSAARVIDPNGAVTHAAFDALGLPVALAYAGAHGEGDGLDAPSVVIERDLLAMEREGSPVAVRIAVRTQHGNPASPWERMVAYFDGHGRQIQRKCLAEPATEGAVDRWVLERHAVAGGSARVYGPGFTHDERFSAEDELGGFPVSRVLSDGMGREIERVRPDGARERKVFAAWHREVWDANDAVIGSDWHIRRRAPGASPLQEAEAVAAGAHADTPTVEHLDPHGRVFLSVEDGGSAGPSATRLDLDANGNPRSITDPRQIVTEQRRLDMLGRPLRIRSTASGMTRTLLDAEDQPVLAWGARGQKQRWSRDSLGRPLVREVQPAGGAWRVAERLVWGEQEPEVGRYRRGRLFRHYDGAGLMELLEHDFRGNPVITIRRFRKDLDVAADWRPPDGVTDHTAIETAALARLAEEFFQRNQHHDALGRALSRSIGPGGSTIQWRYGPRGLISGITVSVGGATTEVLRSPTYDAAGRRTGAVLGNGVRESSLYDEGSGFLRRRTTDLPDERPLRDLTLAHDAVGNVLAIEDAAQPRLYFRNAAVGPDRNFRYDALYRLVQAQGREAALPAQPPPDRAGEPAPFPLPPGPNDLRAVRAYTERYAYDRSGNMTRLDHVASGADWTQIFDIDTESDRLVRVRASDGEGASAARYRIDDAGNLLAARMVVPEEAEPFVWDEDERLVAVDLGGGGRAVYVYDGAGQRVAKLLLRQRGGREERFSIDGFDVFRRLSGGGELEQEVHTLHVDGGEGRLLLVEQFVPGRPGQGFPTLWRYQHGDEVGSCWLETDQNARPVSFEEFRPFGTAAYRAERPAPTPRTRFRFGGREHDTELGLVLYGVRYYAPWLCCWISPDPGGMLDGTNRYWFARDNPTTNSDPTGLQSQPRTLSGSIRFSDYLNGLTGLQSIAGIAVNQASNGLELLGQYVGVLPTRVVTGSEIPACLPPECHPPASSLPSGGSSTHLPSSSNSTVAPAAVATSRTHSAHRSATSSSRSTTSSNVQSNPVGADALTQVQLTASMMPRAIAISTSNSIPTFLRADVVTGGMPELPGPSRVPAIGNPEGPLEFPRIPSERSFRLPARLPPTGTLTPTSTPDPGVGVAARALAAIRAAAGAAARKIGEASASVGATLSGIGAGPLLVAAALILAIITYQPRGPQASYWDDSLNPLTGRPYRGQQDFEQAQVDIARHDQRTRRNYGPNSLQLPTTTIPEPALDPTTSRPAAAPANRIYSPANDPLVSHDQAVLPGAPGPAIAQLGSNVQVPPFPSALRPQAERLQSIVDNVQRRLASRSRYFGISMPFFRLGVGGSYRVLSGQAQIILTANDPMAYWVLRNRLIQLPQGIITPPQPPRLGSDDLLLPEDHVEMSVFRHALELGWESSVITTSRNLPACVYQCNPYWTNAATRPVSHPHFNLRRPRP